MGFNDTNGGASGNGQNPNSTVQNQKQPQGTGFVNTQQYINANQNNQLGQAVSQGINGQTQQTQNDINSGQNTFNQQSQANQANTAANQQLVQNTFQNATNLNPGQQQQFGNLISGNYQGPTGIANQQQLQNEISNVGQLGQAVDSAGGQQALLQNFVGKGNAGYGAGEQTLDTALLGQTGGNQLNQARMQALQLQASAPGVFQGAQNQAQQYANQAQQFGQNVQQELGQNVQSTNQALQQQAQAAQSANDQALQQFKTNLSNNQLTQQEAQQLGVSAGQGTYNVNAANFIAANPLQATAQNVATPQQVAQLQALQSLSGGYAPQQAQQILQQYAGAANQAGTYANAPAYTVNEAGYQTALGNAQNAYNTALSPAQSRYTTAQQIASIMNNPNINQDQAIAQVRAIAPGAVGGTGYGQDRDWANANLTQSQAAYQAALQQLQGTYGIGQYSIIDPTNPASATAQNQTGTGGTNGPQNV